MEFIYICKDSCKHFIDMFFTSCTSGYGGKLTSKHYFTYARDRDEFCKWVRATQENTDRPLSWNNLFVTSIS